MKLEGVASDFSIILMVEAGESAVVNTNAATEALTPEDAMAIQAGAQAGDLLVLQGNQSGETTRALMTSARERWLTSVLNSSPLRDFLPGLWPLVDAAFSNEGKPFRFCRRPRLLVGRAIMSTSMFSPEVRERAVRLVLDNEREHSSRLAAIESIPAKIGCVPQFLHERVKKAEINFGKRPGIPDDMAEKIKALEREDRALRHANEILRKASACRQAG